MHENLTILMYHSVQPDPINRQKTRASNLVISESFFKSQLTWISEHCTILPVIEALQANHTNHKPKISLTFDDGYADNFYIVADHLQRHAIRATFYISVNLMGRPNMLSPQQIQELADCGHEIGSHTLSHPFLPSLQSWTELEKEVFQSKVALQDLLGRSVSGFCYPSGGHNDNVVEAVKRAGYSYACTTVRGCMQTGDNPFLLRRRAIMPDYVSGPIGGYSETAFRGEIAGLHDAYRRWLHRAYMLLQRMPFYEVDAFY